MGLGQVFAATNWIAKKLATRAAKYIYILILIVVIFPAIAFRIQAALFARRAQHLVSRLYTLEIGRTSKRDVLSRMAEFKLQQQLRGVSYCQADECLSIEVESSKLSVWWVQQIGKTNNSFLYSVSGWWGLRYGKIHAVIDLTSGKVSGLGYGMLLSSVDPGYPGVVGIDVTSANRMNPIAQWPLSEELDESPDFQVSHYFKWPALDTGIVFTANAPTDAVQHAFDLRLGCLWSLSGCREANQLLPEPERDRQRIERAVIERMRGPNQCPDRILVHRARDVEDIILVEVTSVSPMVVQTQYGQKYQFASFRLLRVLKGQANRQLDDVGVTPDLPIPETGVGPEAPLADLQVHNSAIDLLTPGQKVLLFSGHSQYIDEPCEAVAATASALRTIEDALAREGAKQ